MIRLPNSTFVHVPRTGGLWLGEVVRRLGIKAQFLTGDIDSHTRYVDLPLVWKRGTPFAFVRHPWGWLKSRWTHAVEHNIAADYRMYGIHRIFDECVRDTFAGTIEAVLEGCPGIVGLTYSQMLRGVTLLRQTEGLPDAAWKLLQELEGLPPEAEQHFLETPKFNSTSDLEKYREEIDRVPSSLALDFLRREKTAIRIWASAGEGRG